MPASTAAHQALKLQVDLFLNRFPCSANWKRRPDRPHGQWVDQLHQDNHSPADLWRSAIRRGLPERCYSPRWLHVNDDISDMETAPSVKPRADSYENHHTQQPTLHNRWIAGVLTSLTFITLIAASCPVFVWRPYDWQQPAKRMMKKKMDEQSRTQFQLTLHRNWQCLLSLSLVWTGGKQQWQCDNGNRK